jgi:ABC-type sugar transport system ATPase subunit
LRSASMAAWRLVGVRRGRREVTFRRSRDALNVGISIIEQELPQVPAMSVAENIVFGREPLAGISRINSSRIILGQKCARKRWPAPPF